MNLSFAKGETSLLLLKTTIDEVFRKTVESFSGDEALVVCHQGVRLTWMEFDCTVMG